jgi:Flp pilus assembly protein CpaB
VAHKKAIVIIAVALSAIALAGFVSVSLTGQEPAADRPNDRANHHPVHVNG